MLGCVLAAAQVEAPSASLDLTQAKQLLEQGKVSDAIDALRQLQQTAPQIKGLQHLLGVAYYRQGDYVQAAPALARAIEQDPDDREAVQLRGLSLFHLGNPADAIPLLEKVHSWLPTSSVDATYVLGVAYIQTKDYANARRAFAEMFAVPPDSAASYLFLARMLLRQGYDPIAEQNALKAVALDPRLPLAHFLLGEFDLYKSKVPEAIAEFEAELKLNPAFAGSYDRLADAYFRSSRFDDAQKLLQRSIVLDANATGPYILMGKVLLKKEEPAQALLYLQRAAKMDPSNFMTHHLLGQAYRALNNNEAAERELKLAEKLQTAQSPLQ